MPWWNFVDWVPQWPNGVPPAEADGGRSSALELQLLLAYQWASNLESILGSKALAAEYQASAETLKATIILDNWVPERGLLADQPSHLTYSQQVNTLAVLAPPSTDYNSPPTSRKDRNRHHPRPFVDLLPRLYQRHVARSWLRRTLSRSTRSMAQSTFPRSHHLGGKRRRLTHPIATPGEPARALRTPHEP